MRKILGVVVLCFFIFNTSSNAGNINGKGELKMSNQSVENFIYYIKINKKLIDGKRPKPEAFLISQDGSWSWYFYCTWNDCRQNDKVKIEQVRNLLTFTNKSSFSKDLKIIVINNAESLNINSANALLKVIENVIVETLNLMGIKTVNFM